MNSGVKAEEPSPSELPLAAVPEREIGRGESGVVYAARLPDGGARVALKVGWGSAERARFAGEGTRLVQGESPSLVALLDAGVVGTNPHGLPPGAPYLVLGWAEGAPLAPLDVPAPDRERLALTVARDVGEALAALHAAGVAHGDVKPANVVVGPDPDTGALRATLLDLGLGQDADATETEGGTLRYLAPEWRSAESLGDARARDLFALGLVVAEAASAASARSDVPADAARSTTLPPTLAGIVSALLDAAPAARPSAEWVRRRAATGLGEDPRVSSAEARARAVKQAYLAVRAPDVARAISGGGVELAVTGMPRQWLAARAAKLARLAALRDESITGPRAVLPDLDALGRARVLTALVGSAAASWPVPAFASDAAFVERLLAVAALRDPRALSLADLSVETLPAETDSRELLEDPVELALALGASAPAARVLDRGESYVTRPDAPLSLVLAVARALRLAGAPERALSVLGARGEPECRLETAECRRRLGERESAIRIAEAVPLASLGPRARGRRTATLARALLDSGDTDGAERVLDAAEPTAPVLEVRALLELGRGALDAARLTAERGRAAATSDEERARLAAVVGNVAHATGDAERALTAFREAADHATRAGAILEEATYLTGVAAAGFDAGALGVALDAATRATLLFEHLGRPRETARAVLARSAVYGAAGATVLARDAAEAARERAAAAGDVRCEAFAHLVLADVAPPLSSEGRAHAGRALSLLEGALPEDRLRAAARLLAHDGEADTASLDRVAEDGELAAPSRLEWWGARAGRLTRETSPVRPDRVLSAITALADARAPASDRGVALSAAATLAARLGDGDLARRLSVGSLDSAARLLAGAPPELRASVAALPWVTRIRAPRDTAIFPEQLADVESLVRALGTRDRLRPLLDQVLDALVLWTGVERGLLLLRAPGGKLVPRAARNIAREDLGGVQLALSRSLAERALATGEPVVAVDAAGELPEVHKSVHALKLRSVLAVPLVAHGKALGVVYLDDRVRRGAFGPAELGWVRLVATLAAVAIGEARDQLALRRAARRATRAEARLARELSHREAELDVAERELARTREGRTTRFAYDEILGDSAPIRTLLALVDRVTQAEVPVLIAGESGSGKELVARAIHRNGPRGAGPFVGENCGAVPETLLESLLFGHVRGAFTGASRPHAGLLEVASGGTLFLDEIGEMSLGMQTKLLRVLEDGEVRPIGGERSRRVDIRVIAATHRDLAKMVEAGKFRQDLFYRLNVIRVDVPSLRERPGDVEVLARHFVAKHTTDRGTRLSRAAIDTLAQYSWPGNVRQLENEIRRLLVLSDGVIGKEHLSPEVRDGAQAEARREDGLNVRRRVDALEVELVRAALERTRGNQTRAAELLGLSRFGLQKMIRRLEIPIPSGTSLREDGGAVSGER